MKILYVSQYFPPEMGAPAGRAAELSRLWAEEGHEVAVLTGFPNHPTGIVPPVYRRKIRHLVAREIYHGVNVVRTWLLPFPNRKAYERMLNYSSFCISAAATGLFLHQPDVFLAGGWPVAMAYRSCLKFAISGPSPWKLSAPAGQIRCSMAH